MDRIKILVLTDSRGTGLEKDIRDEIRAGHPDLRQKIQVTVQVVRGATIENIIEKADKRFNNAIVYDITYTFVGVNNLTTKLNNGMVIPKFDNVPELVESLTNGYTKLKSDLEKRSKKVVISQIVGIHLDMYNSYMNEGFWYYHQNTINEAMPLLAHTLNFINRANHMTGPWITNTIHDYVNHKLYNRYAKLHDGLHPTVSLRKKWSKLFVNAIVKNL